MLCTHGTESFHCCDFCGRSDKAPIAMFVSEIDHDVAICKTCADTLPFVVGKVTVLVRPQPATAGAA